MAATARTETITMDDGGTMDAHVAVPERGSGPAMLVVMEIFGVGAYIRGAAERLAELGYVALAPDLYRRIRPGAQFGRTEDELRAAMAASHQLDADGAIADAGAALAHLRTLPEVDGAAAGAVGFCLGGTLAFGLAAAADPATTVCYYGSGIPDMLDDAAARISAPVLMHWGAEDPYIPLDDARRACAVAESRPGWECHIHPDGGHAFDNWDNPMFHRPEPAARAWEQTRTFLARTLPVGR